MILAAIVDSSYNVRGDVVQRVDGNGDVIHTYRYDAFGNQLNGDVVNTNPFRFAGEYYDWETGFIYLRARFYNPVLGRFISEDPYWTIHNMQNNVASIMQAGNLFVYAINNPIMWIDPSGLKIRVHGTAEQRQTVLSYAQMLTDHSLAIDADGFMYISRMHDGVENFPNENAWIARMIANEHIIEVNFASGDSSNLHRPHCRYAASDPIRGSGSDIYFNPALRVYTWEQDPATGLAVLARVPTELVLAHELIHGDRAQRGVAIPLTLGNRSSVTIEVARAPLSPLRLTHGSTFTRTHWFSHEEFATIGIRHVEGGIGITENMIRAARGLNRRVSWYGESRS